MNILYKFEKQLLKEIQNHLEGLSTGYIRPEYPKYGICFEIENRFKKRYSHKYDYGELIQHLALDWEEYSGNFEFPVPHPFHKYENALSAKNLAKQAYYDCVTFGNMWLFGEVYGDSRRRLCAYIALQIKIYLGEMS